MHPSEFSDSMPLGEARAKLRELVDEGHTCPCCTQFAKVYRRKIHATMARGLISLYRAGAADDFIHAPSATKRDANVETAKLVYWGLVEQMEGRRPDGGRPGWYRLTELGLRWVRGEATISKYARIYDDRCLQLLGDQVTIRDALGDKFDYRELMEAA